MYSAISLIYTRSGVIRTRAREHQKQTQVECTTPLCCLAQQLWMMIANNTSCPAEVAYVCCINPTLCEKLPPLLITAFLLGSHAAVGGSLHCLLVYQMHI